MEPISFKPDWYDRAEQMSREATEQTTIEVERRAVM